MEDTLFLVFGIPAIVFMAVVAPTWIIFHYLTQARRDRQLKTAMSAQDQEMLSRLVRLMDRMETRIGALESILDADRAPRA